MVDPIPPLSDHSFRIESEHHIAHVLLVLLDSNELEGNHPIPTVQGGDPPIPIM